MSISLLAAIIPVFIALAVYYDAKLLCNPKATMWAFLCGFLLVIPIIIYVCRRSENDPRKRCFHCGTKAFTPFYVCPTCGQPNTYDLNTLEMISYAKNRKTFMTLSIVTLSVFVFIIVAILIIGWIAVSTF